MKNNPKHFISEEKVFFSLFVYSNFKLYSITPTLDTQTRGSTPPPTTSPWLTRPKYFKEGSLMNHKRFLSSKPKNVCPGPLIDLEPFSLIPPPLVLR